MHRHPLDSFPEQLRRELATWPTRESIAADGSNRRFFRLRRGNASCICLYHPQPPGSPVTENDSYALIGRHLWQLGLPVPEIYTYCREEGWFLVQDLGDTSLQEAVRRLADRQHVWALYRQALDLLLALQQAGTPGFDPGWCFDTPLYDAELVYTRECRYFQTAFLEDYLGWQQLPATLAQDFALLVDRALASTEQAFLHRDFQSRNLLVHQGRLWLIDFQGARLGPSQYDLAALLLDPYVRLSPALQDELLAAYLSGRADLSAGGSLVWRQQYRYLALCRNLQMLGAYGFLSRQQGKPFFQQFIPDACRSLLRQLDALPRAELPTLRDLAQRAWKQLTAQRDGGAQLR
ncbi:MAG: aminoglycoside phosphotransferase family protein [Desulfobacca sp.]|uniref:aminoglycoside phosphotransferase family protein n=1 Tax=Desulfobacca sp. TaxID=2067990 RepID=UPI00404A99C1